MKSLTLILLLLVSTGAHGEIVNGKAASYLDQGERVKFNLSHVTFGDECNDFGAFGRGQRIAVYCYLNSGPQANCACLLEKLLGSDIYQGKAFEFAVHLEGEEWVADIMRDPVLLCE